MLEGTFSGARSQSWVTFESLFSHFEGNPGKSLLSHFWVTLQFSRILGELGGSRDRNLKAWQLYKLTGLQKGFTALFCRKTEAPFGLLLCAIRFEFGDSTRLCLQFLANISDCRPVTLIFGAGNPNRVAEYQLESHFQGFYGRGSLNPLNLEKGYFSPCRLLPQNYL